MDLGYRSQPELHSSARQFAGGPIETLLTGGRGNVSLGYCSAVVSLSAVQAEQCAGGPSENQLTGGRGCVSLVIAPG